MSTDRIEKRIELKAPLSRVWRALTDHREFGSWFGANIETPFEVGKMSKGRITTPGAEHYKWEALVQKMDHERLFSFLWPHPADPAKDGYENSPKTLVEFRLEKRGEGTLLTVTESGFDQLPADRRAQAFRDNEGGWEYQMGSIRKYVGEA